MFIRECFRYESAFGYLLSNGIVGCFNKENQTNLIFEFGQEYYYTVEKNEKSRKQQVPEDNDGDRNLMLLLHFRAFFVTKYSLFKME